MTIMVSAVPVWSVDRLEKACRKAFLERARVKAGELPPNTAATAGWDSGSDSGLVLVKLDALKVGLQAGVVHELIHVVLGWPIQGFDKETSETIVEALEEKLDRYINQSPRRIRWWRRQIGLWIEIKTLRR